MYTSLRKIYSLGISTALVFGIFVLLPGSINTAHAQTCSAGDTVGNISGFAMSDELGPIYMNTETWNDDPLSVGHPTTTHQFSVSYNRNLNIWGGTGWSPYIGTIDFGGINSANTTSRTAELTDIIGDAQWGNWSPIIELTNVEYNSDPGGFQGTGWNGQFTIEEGANNTDVLVGMGNIDFSNVSLTELPCSESVDLFIGSSNTGTAATIYRENCSIIDPVISWTTNDIVPGSCVTGSGLWSGGSGASKPDNNPSGEDATGNITPSNSPVVFSLTCEGAGSGALIEGTAIASCGSPSDTTDGNTNPIDPTEGIVIPEFKEV